MIVKYIRTLLLSLSLPFALIGQPTGDTIWFDKAWNQTVKGKAAYFRLVSIDTTNISFIVRDHYLNGAIQMVGGYQAINPDFKTGLFRYWHPNGTLKIHCTFEQNMLHGPAEEFYDNGQKQAEMTYQQGLLHGTLKTWERDGRLIKTAEYHLGRKNGKFVTYYDNGLPIRTDQYKNDRMVRGRCYTREGKDTAWFDYFVMPSFIGGTGAFISFLRDKLNYPEKAVSETLEGVAKIRFTIDTEGNITLIGLLKGEREYFNQEALRVIALSPRWLPGRRDGKPVQVTVHLPFHFLIP